MPNYLKVPSISFGYQLVISTSCFTMATWCHVLYDHIRILESFLFLFYKKHLIIRKVKIALNTSWDRAKPKTEKLEKHWEFSEKVRGSYMKQLCMDGCKKSKVFIETDYTTHL